MYKKNKKLILTVIISVVALAGLLVCNFLKPATGDKSADKLLSDLIPRAIAGICFTAFIALSDFRSILVPDLKNCIGNLVWCIPCFLVVAANFPFTALAIGTAKIIRPDLIWLFAINCLGVAVMEESLFRGIIQEIAANRFKGKACEKLLIVSVTSAVFALFHLFNLFAGAGIGATLLQVGYSFLIGAMLSAVLLKTNNLWLCVAMHALFNFGGNLIPAIGLGAFQDSWFWIFTAATGVICLVHIVLYLIGKESSPSVGE